MPQDTIWTDTKNSYVLITDIKGAAITNDSIIIEKLLYLDSIDKTSVYAYNSKNNAHADSIMNVVMKRSKISIITDFDEKKAYYDKMATKLEFLVTLGLIALIFYAIYRAIKKAQNPFAEDEKGWIEIGSSPRNNFGDHPDNNYLLYRKPTPQKIPDCLVYNGYDLKFSDEQIVAVLEKRFPYFKQLGFAERTRFLNRLKKFMKSKIFKIHDKSGFKEMPILLSATAIQISFGLDEYMLPYYQYFHIFPQEFLGVEPSIRFLQGNVSGKAINISWKHFLKGYELENDGQNVGLHEMAHAYYCQNFTFRGNKDDGFIQRFPTYTNNSNKVFEAEKTNGKGLYSEYALKNFQEFWAESVEIFFEKPKDMKAQYPDLYASMTLLLNQKTV
jgi:hypothetical protein